MHLRDPKFLVQCMDARDLTVRTLAERVGVSRSAIGHLRSGKRTSCSIPTAKKIGAALGVPYEVLFVERLSNVTREIGRAA